MITKKEQLQNSKLYVILSPGDAARLGISMDQIAEEAILGGADVIQLRDKTSGDRELIPLARRLSEMCLKHGALFIVNDRPAVARESQAGLHVGQDDLSVAEARRLVGGTALIGKSTHSPEQALEAEKEGPDYIGFGPIFSTPTKPDYKPVGLESITPVANSVRIPFFAIGGVDPSNVAAVLRHGAERVAVVRAAVRDLNIQEAVRKLKNELMRGGRGNDKDAKEVKK